MPEGREGDIHKLLSIYGSGLHLWEKLMIILGIVLLVLGLVLSIHLLYIVGIILLVVGAVLFLLGSSGRAVGGRRHYY